MLRFYYFIIFTVYSSLYLYGMNYLHIQYHLKDSYLEKYNWFKKNKKLHMIHHIKYKKNMNILDHTSDKINGNYLSILE